jgi:endonuclease/exonuclease/phosphatase family metal-dependent hydrolase
MKKSHHVLRVATYNIHKCRGLDRRVRPERILDVLKHINADIIALQEVLSIEGGSRGDQLRFVAAGYVSAIPFKVTSPKAGLCKSAGQASM